MSLIIVGVFEKRSDRKFNTLSREREVNRSSTDSGIRSIWQNNNERAVVKTWPKASCGGCVLKSERLHYRLVRPNESPKVIAERLDCLRILQANFIHVYKPVYFR